MNATPTFRICGLAVSKCTLLAEKDYKNMRHDKIAAAIHGDLYKKYGFDFTEKLQPTQ
jgi:hypothetical protein